MFGLLHRPSADHQVPLLCFSFKQEIQQDLHSQVQCSTLQRSLAEDPHLAPYGVQLAEHLAFACCCMRIPCTNSSELALLHLCRIAAHGKKLHRSKILGVNIVETW